MKTWIYKIISYIVIVFHCLQAAKEMYQTLDITAQYEKNASLIEGKGDPFRKPCPDEGILVKHVRIQRKDLLKDLHTCSKGWFKDLNNDDVNINEINLLKTVKRECNGKNQCDFQQTWNIKPLLHCNGSSLPSEEIKITVICLPIDINNSSVFELKSIKNVSIKIHQFYLISRGQNIDYVCFLSGNGNKIKINLLHIEMYGKDNTDWSQTGKRNETVLFSVKDSNENVSICSNSKNLTELNNSHISVKNATLEFVMFSGFIWIEMEALSSLSWSSIDCYERQALNWSSIDCDERQEDYVDKNLPTNVILIAVLVTSLVIIVFVCFLVLRCFGEQCFVKEPKIKKSVSQTSAVYSSRKLVEQQDPETDVLNITKENADNIRQVCPNNSSKDNATTESPKYFIVERNSKSFQLSENKAKG